jgi:hypothetical protein
MATPTKAKPKIIRPLENYSATSDQDVVKVSNAVVSGMTGNSHFTTPPVDLPALKTDTDKLNALISEATDGSKKVISEKNKQRVVVIKKLKLLGRYVEIMSDNDPAIFNTSGFPAASTTRTPPQPLPMPVIRKITHGIAGQLLVAVKGHRKAKSYELRYAPIVNGVPTNWITIGVPNVKSAIPVNGLTPGTTYAFQARALGPLGHTDYTDSATFMAT